MKKLSYLLAGVLISLPLIAHSQSSTSFWKLVGTRLRPIINTYRVDSAGGFSGTTLTVSGLKSCTGIKTNANGVTSCGVTGSSINTGAILNSGNDRWVNVSGDTMTGSLNIRANLSGSALFTLSGYKGCTLKTTATGMTVCGTDNNTTAHSALTGLADDDHTQYHTDARALTWLNTRSTTDLPEGARLYFTDERTDDRVDALIVDGTNISTSYNDGLGTLTINATDTTYTAGEGLSLNGTAFSRIAAMTGTSLEIFGTISGALITQNGSGSNYFRGRLGIGTTAPRSPLHVFVNNSTGTVIIQGGVNTVTASGGINATLDFMSNDASVLLSSPSARIATFNDSTNGSDVGLSFYTYRQAGTPPLGEKMRITADGDIGIGVKNPLAKFHIFNSIISTLMTGDSMFMRNHYQGAGWARSLLGFENDAGTDYWSIGGYGSGQSSTYGWIGQSWIGSAIKWTASDYVGIAISSTISPAIQLAIGDANTGFQQTAEDVLSLYTGGVRRLTALSNGYIGIGTTTPKSTLAVVGSGSFTGTVSGSSLFAMQTLASSGSLVFEGAGSGSSLYIATSIQGAGLTDCDIAGTSKLLWDSTTGRFSCGTDQGGGGGISQTDGDARYVRKAGSTMTGALTINITGGGRNTIGLNILNFLSGAVLHAEKTLTSSGNLVVENGSYLSGAVIMARGTYPSTPSNDHLALFANGGDFDREMLKVIDSDANNYHLQPSFFGNFVTLVGPGSTATTLNSVGEGVTATATLSQPTPTEAIPFASNFATTTTSGNESGFIGLSTPYVRGSTTGANGFFFSARVIPVDIALVRHFVGLTDQANLAAVMASDNIASHDTAQFQFSTVRGDTNWQFVTKDATTQNTVNTGMAVTANNTYDFYIYCKKQCSTMYWKIKNKTANTSAQGSTSSNLPGAAIFMRKFLGVETQTTAAKSLRMQSMYTEMQGAAN